MKDIDHVNKLDHHIQAVILLESAYRNLNSAARELNTYSTATSVAAEVASLATKCRKTMLKLMDKTVTINIQEELTNEED